MKIKIINHSLIQHKLTLLRDKKTNSKDFREYLDEISRLLAFEVLRNIKLKEIEIETPIKKTTGKILNEKINLFPILRAGQGMVEGFLGVVPNAKIGHIGLYRDEKTLEPKKYLFKFPSDAKKESLNIILDPMIATGGSAIEALKILKKEKIKNIKFVSIVTVEEAVLKINKKFPEVELITCSVDQKLNQKGYIIPGLGDAGDRIYGTK
ncbi:uracil phosphoribosyltransferase [Candidatus Hepatoplasma crinochetorum]|uniref:Uracil phosphoribosyltransferase n=1 Tax=Candidatus Hepatoplasma crinochetorum Av TaxID=1427984 RepID=W8GMI2_9MOLU|nr:uracil phosphoribosyltransferase [Candidatus Hepatoplasma crinochetorum]AHK22236.1 Uracil phosphoribosyltransferase [Candidatus Hepatoplasma crinochetorum Av]BDV02823.1 MAG: uracil phosphoribosyltransferase [Candidatus Hepatoplasma crinochetorum]